MLTEEDHILMLSLQIAKNPYLMAEQLFRDLVPLLQKDMQELRMRY